MNVNDLWRFIMCGYLIENIIKPLRKVCILIYENSDIYENCSDIFGTAIFYQCIMS